MQAASVASNTATTTTFVTTAKPPIPVAVLPTQPLKMEVVNPVGNLKPTEQITVKTTGGPTMKIPGTILLAGKNGISVEVEAMTSSLPQAPVAQVSLQPAQAMPAGAAVAPGLPSVVTEVVVQAAGPASVASVAPGNGNKAVIVSAGALPAEELKTTNNVNHTPAASRSFQIVTTGGAGVVSSGSIAQGRLHHEPRIGQSLDTILEAIKHLEGDHQFSEDSHKVVKEEIVEYSIPIQAQATNLSSQHHHVTLTKNLVPSKIVGIDRLKPVVSTSTMVTTNPIPATLLPQQPHPPSAVLHQQNLSHAHPTVTKSESNSIIIVKSCQT